MASHSDNGWEDTLTTPRLYPAEQTPDFASYAFDTTGWTKGEIDVASRPRSAAPLSFPTDDFSTFNFDTPHRGQAPLSTPIVSHEDFDDEFPISPFEPCRITTSHLRAARKRFDAANEHADIILAINRDRADARDTPRPLFDTAVNLPRGALPSLHTHVPVTDEVRKAIGQSSAAGKKRVRDEEEKENGGGEDGGRVLTTSEHKTKFLANDLIHIVRVVIDAEPFLAPHKMKGATWKLVVETLVKQGFRFPNVSPATVRNKAEALVAFKKNPSQNTKLANIIGEGTSASVTMGALLERLETQFDQARGKSDDAKVEAKKKNDENREGGEAIRSSSMKTLRSQPRTSGSDDEDVSTDNETSPTPSRTITATSSIEIVDSDDETSKPRKNKRRRRNPSSDAEGLLTLMQAENERRAKHDERIAQAFDTFVGNCSRQKDEYITLLKDLIASDRQNDA